MSEQENYRQIYLAKLFDYGDGTFDVRVTRHFVVKEYGKLHVLTYSSCDYIYPERKLSKERHIDMSGYTSIGPARVGSFCSGREFFAWTEKEALDGAKRLLEYRCEKLKQLIADTNKKIKSVKSAYKKCLE